MQKINRTTTPVHDAAAMRDMRNTVHLKETNTMLAVSMFAQILSFGALYLQPVAANSSWWAGLTLLLPTLLLYAMSRIAAKRLPAQALDTPFFRVLFFLYALLFVCDMAMCLLSIVELTDNFLLFNASRLQITLAVLFAVLLAMPARRPQAALRAASFLRWFFLGAFALSIALILPQFDTGYLFPLAGYGVRHTLRTGALCAGSVWSAAVLPFLAPNADVKLIRQARGYLPLCAAVLLVVLLFFCCALVIPAPQLSGSWGYALRLQLLMEVSANTLSWSLLIISELLLFLTALAASGDLARTCMQRALNRRRISLAPFLLLCLPPVLIGSGTAENLFIAVLPWRFPLALLIAAAALIYSLLSKKKEAAPS